MLLIAGAAGAAAAAPYAVRLNTDRCAAIASDKLAGLGPEWPALGAFAQRCSIPGPDGRIALEVDIVRIDRANKVGFFDARANMRVPMPVIRDLAGKVLGSLPDGLPVDPPGRLLVRFTEWHGGRPLTIRLYQAGESAIGPHALAPLRWDARTGKYA
ncbi:MAG: hypothetical protein ACRYG8_18895 [Janthinobacterium lividum]